MLCVTPFLPIFFEPSIPPKKLEEVLWTSDTTRTYFFGPGTLPSIQRAEKIKKQVKESFDLESTFPYPIYIAPEGQSNLLEMIEIAYPFNVNAAVHIQKIYKEELKKLIAVP